MAKRVIMPALGIAQDTGLIIAWLKKEGDWVEAGEPLMEVETDKATAEIEAEASGILTNITAFVGDAVPVAETIAWILAEGEPLPEEAKDQWRATAKESAVTDAPSPQPAPLPALVHPPSQPVSASPVASRMAQDLNLDLSLVKPSGGKVTKQDIVTYLSTQETAVLPSNGARLLPASPKARRLAQEKGYDLEQIKGSGPKGAILTDDVLNYHPVLAKPATVPQPSISGISQAWRVMAQRLTDSWTSVPHFYLMREVNATALLNWREVAQKQTDEKVTITDLLTKAVAAALQLHPRVNASWVQEDVHMNEEINVGLAVATDDGLIVPVIHQTNQLSVSEITAQRKEIVTRALAGKLKLKDLQGGTFTISNLGMFGVDAFIAIVNPPQAAILAVGKSADRVIPLSGVPAVCPIMVATLSFDHRVVDGARGARFLDTLVSFLEQPLGIL